MTDLPADQRKSIIPLKASTARMRRHRERAKSGSIYVRFEMTPAAVHRLIELGWLKPDGLGKPIAVTEAFLKFGARALWPQQK
jgi:hypothetical protein